MNKLFNPLLSGARDVGRVPRDLAVPLLGVHVAVVEAAALHLAGHDDRRSRAHGVDVHVPVGAVHEVFLGFSSLSSNFWQIFGKLSEARSRLHQLQILQANIRLKALDGIYMIYTQCVEVCKSVTF